MKFIESRLEGVLIIEPELIEDDRGFFARTWCKKEFEARGICQNIVQCNISFNKKKGTLRGMHYQEKPHAEAKLVSCTAGSIFDVIIDLREESRTFREWFSVELSEENRKILYIPEDFAHGYQTLEDNTSIFYQMSEYYHPECVRVISWNDPAFGITWPHTKERIISKRDLFKTP